MMDGRLIGGIGWLWWRAGHPNDRESRIRGRDGGGMGDGVGASHFATLDTDPLAIAQTRRYDLLDNHLQPTIS